MKTNVLSDAQLGSVFGLQLPEDDVITWADPLVAVVSSDRAAAIAAHGKALVGTLVFSQGTPRHAAGAVLWHLARQAPLQVAEGLKAAGYATAEVAWALVSSARPDLVVPVPKGPRSVRLGGRRRARRRGQKAGWGQGTSATPGDLA